MNFLSQYMQADVDVAEYIWYVVRIRVAPVAVICALGCTQAEETGGCAVSAMDRLFQRDDHDLVGA